MESKFNKSRRDFMISSASVAAVAAAAAIPLKASAKDADSPSRSASPKKNRKSASTSRPNILFIFTDQERRFDRLPAGYRLPGHEKLAAMGTTFKAHQISSCMCTSSRSVILTGLQTPDNGMFENVDMPYVKNMSTKVPTLGHMLRKAGYYTAYKGKWHLNRDFENPPPGTTLTAKMDEYGFADFYSPGDSLAHDLGGYEFDHMIGASAVTWLRRKGSEMEAANTPWSLTVSLVNPHDIMYFNADAPGENVQDTGKLLMHAARAPNNAAYRKEWHAPLSSSLRQPVDEKGRPAAHAEYHKAWGYCLGHIPLKDENWHRFTDFYLNSIRTVDAQVLSILNELEALGMADNTVVVFTADHGEMGGAHGLRGKGPFAYRESLNVPFYVIHPDVKGGGTVESVTSHIDIVPSLLAMAGVKETSSVAGRDLPGRDFSTALAANSRDRHAVRPGALFTYSGISTNDSEVIRIVAAAKAAGKDPKKAMKEAGYQPNLKKRGTLRSFFDGRYKFTRYFSPMERHSPKDLQELFARNDVELFDLDQDPTEMKNLALDPAKNAKLLAEMNAKLEAAILAEIGKDDGREMPAFAGIDWTMDRMDL